MKAVAGLLWRPILLLQMRIDLLDEDSLSDEMAATGCGRDSVVEKPMMDILCMRLSW